MNMYTKPIFAPKDRDAIFDLIYGVVAGILITPHASGIAITHLSFLAERSRGANGTLVSHLARANEHAALVEQGLPSAVVFTGPNAYVSSSWYPGFPKRDNAPTWNYAVVHCRGPLVPYNAAKTAQHIVDLVAHLERHHERPWSVRELGQHGMARRLPHILGFEMPIATLNAKFKLGQDEPWTDTSAAIGALEDVGALPLATLMRAYNGGRDGELATCPARCPPTDGA
jgi:transcriptional regulator